MEDINKDKWITTMHLEIELMCYNFVKKLVEKTHKVRHIGCKWFYMEKRGVDGYVQAFKARTVGQGFT